jgi:uncharacterized protein YndB with AHSA1/START domain
VFAALTDVESLPQWQDTALSVTRDGEGPTRLGSRWVERRRFMGRDSDANVEVVAFEPDRVLTLAIKSGPISLEVRHELTAVEAGTDVLVQATGGEGIPRIMRGVAVRMVGKQAAADFATLKARLETPAPTG